MAETLVINGRDWAEDADLDAPELNDDFGRIMNSLAESVPVSRSNVGTGYWVANGFDTVREVAQDWGTFSNAEGFQPNADPNTPPLYPQQLNPPHHTRWRNALAPYFTARGVKVHREAAVEHANALIDEFIDRGSVDFIADFAGPFPGRFFFTRYLGMPLEDLPAMREALMKALLGPVDQRGEGWREMQTRLEQHLQKRQQMPPQGDVLDAVLTGVPDDDGEPVTWAERVSIATDLVAGGLGTTTYVLSAIMRHLATHPDDRYRLAADDSLHPHAIEELIRANPPTVATGRTATADVELGGRRIAKGEMVMLNFASACLDSSVTQDPLTVDLSRETPTNAAFGFGAHRCIGAHLARQNLAVVLKEWLTRIPDFEVTPGTEVHFSGGIAREMYELHFTFPKGGGPAE